MARLGMRCLMDELNALQDDGLVIPEVGYWAKRKYHFLKRYLDLLSTGMKNRWKHRIYIDLFSGAGYAKYSGTKTIVPTSSLLAATTKTPFTFMHLCERDSAKCNALKVRIDRHSNGAKYKIHEGDANTCVDDILNGVPIRDSLSIAFVDPFGLHFDFESARKLSQRKVDLIVLLADNMDAMRNWKAYYESNPQSSLDRFIGEPGWREAFNSTPTDKLAEQFRNRYKDQLSTLGYRFFETLQVQNSHDRDIYTLLFASEHQKGLEFWDMAKSVDESGQTSLF